MFKSAAKVFGAHDDEKTAARKRRNGEKESGTPICPPTAIAFSGRIAARGRYVGLRTVRRAAARLRRKFAAAAEDASLPEYAETADFAGGNTLEWLTMWQQNADTGHGFDDNFSAKQDQNIPHP